MTKFNFARASVLKSSTLLFIIISLVSILMGLFTVFFADLVDGRLGVMLALPALIAIGLMFIYDRNLLLLLIVLSRSSIDPLLDNTKLGSFGLGAVLNALVILIALIALFKPDNPARQVLIKTWLPFLVISALTLAWAPDFIAAIKTYLALLSYSAVFCLAITLIESEKDYAKWMLVIFISSLVPVTFGFIDAATGGFVSQDGFRIRSTFSHPNIFAFYLVLMLSVTFYFYKSQVGYISAFWRRTLPVYMFMMLALLAMTKTRSAWVGCFAFFSLYALFYERKYLIYIFLVLIFSLLVPEVRERLLDLTQGNEVVNYSKLNSYAWRKLIWKDGLNWMTPSHYVAGYGLEAFKFNSIDFFSMAGRRGHGAHSVFVQLFFETGLVGLLAFVWLHVKVGNLILPFYKANKLLIFTSIMFLFEFALYAYSDNLLSYLSFNWYLWFVLGATYAVCSKTHNQLVMSR